MNAYERGQTLRPMRMLGMVAIAAVVAGAGLVGATPAMAETAYTWTGGGDDASWGDAANWSPQAVPDTDDSVTITAPSDDQCHAHVAGVPDGLRLADLTLDERPFGGDPDSPCSTSLDGGSIAVMNQFTFHAGVLDTPVTIAIGASGSITPGAAHATTHIGTGGLTVDGTLTLADDSRSGAGGSDEHLSLTGGPGITVDSGATLTATGTNDLGADCCLSPAHLQNRGTVQLSGTTTLDAVELDQDGTVNAAGGATLLTDFAPQTAGDGARWTGSGLWQLGYSSVTTVSGTQTLGRGFSWQLGGNGSPAEEYLNGTFGLAGTGRFLWNGGQIGAAMTVGSGIRFSATGPDGPDHRQLTGLAPDGGHVAVVNRGTMTFGGGAGWHGFAGAQLANAASGVLTLGAGTAIGADCCNTPSSIVNAGRVVVPGGAGTVTVDGTGFRATGGTVAIGAGADLELTGGATGLLSTTTVLGGGTLGVAAPMSTTGTVTVGDRTTLALEAHGALTTTGTSPTTIGGTGAFAWTGGSVTGALTVATAAGQTISGSAAVKRVLVPTGSRGSTVTFAGPTLVLPGTGKAPDVLQSDDGTRLAFTGALGLRANTQIAGGAVTSSGTTTVAAGSGTAALTGHATLTNTGALTVRTGTLASDQTVVQTGGSTTLASGTVLDLTSSSALLRVTGGTFAGLGQLTGNLSTTAATISPGVDGTGTLSVTGTITTTTATTLLLEFGSLAHDVLIGSQAASLRGTLHLVDLPGYQPQTGDTAPVVTAGPPLAASFTCTTTTGDGAATQHWTARVVSRNQLWVTSGPGAPASC